MGVGSGNPTPTAEDAASSGCEPPVPAPGVTLGAAYRSSYKVYQLPAVPGFSANEELVAVTLKSGDPNTLLFGCYPSTSAAGSFCSVGLTRSCGHITGFAGNGVSVGSAPNIDGSLVYAPGGTLLFTGWPENTLGEIPTGAAAPARTIDLTSLGVASSVGSLQIVPPGLPGAGSLKIASYTTGDFYQATLAVGSAGLFGVGNLEHVEQLAGGPEGFAYVPHGSPDFSSDSVIVSEWDNNDVVTYQLDGAGNPVLSTRQVFLQALSGAEGAYFDTVTGDFIFATWNGTCDVAGTMATNCMSTGPDYVYIVQGFSIPTQTQ
jgi:hypothetical protein